MKKLIFAAMFLVAMSITAMAQIGSEYDRSSSEYTRHNRDAMTRPWKYDRGGRLKKGSPYHQRQHARRRRARRR